MRCQLTVSRNRTVLYFAVIDGELQNCIHQASKAFGQLCGRVLLNRNMSTSTKASVHNATCLFLILCGSKSWSAYRAHVRDLELFHIHTLQRILGHGEIEHCMLALSRIAAGEALRLLSSSGSSGGLIIVSGCPKIFSQRGSYMGNFQKACAMLGDRNNVSKTSQK